MRKILRQCVSLAVGAVLAWPFFVLGQAMPFIGMLSTGSPNERAPAMESFRQGLRQGGYVDGKDVSIEYRWAEGRYARLPELAAELVSRKVAVIATSGGPSSGLAAKRATSTIPIVFISAVDPVKAGLVVSLRQPGGNVTGVSSIATSLDVKRLEIFAELLPNALKIAYLVDPNEPSVKSTIEAMQIAAKRLGKKIEILIAGNEEDIDVAFAKARKLRVDAIHVATMALFTNRRSQIVKLAGRYSIPASYHRREFALAGGLMTYGPDYRDVYRQAGLYAARILRGEKPADLPVVQAEKFQLVLNLTTAKKLGITVSRDFLARVDEVIE